MKVHAFAAPPQAFIHRLKVAPQEIDELGHANNVVWVRCADGRLYHPVIAENGPERRHDAVASIGDAVLDRVRFAPVQPVAIAQVRKPLAAAGVRTMALRAVVEEQLLADRQRLRGIVRDMHDGVGSHISAAIHQLQSG